MTAVTSHFSFGRQCKIAVNSSNATFTKERGTVVFAGVASALDTVTIFDGVTTVVFTFGDGTGGTVDTGLTATTSAQNLKAAIAASALKVTVTGATTTITVVNDLYSGGSIAKSGANITANNFVGNAAGDVMKFTTPVRILVCPDVDIHLAVGATADATTILVPAKTFMPIALPANTHLSFLGTGSGNVFLAEFNAA